MGIYVPPFSDLKSSLATNQVRAAIENKVLPARNVYDRSGFLELILFNHTTDLMWGHWLSHKVTQNVIQ